MLVLCAAASAQATRMENDPRNISPTVGTGGNPGGPTGLFTIYDGQTLRRGEFTFSLAYSNYDRDPGNVDISEVPASFQIGLNDHIELFFNTDVYKGVKVNNPRNLSGFYLPNSQPFGAGGGTAPAIVLAPVGPNVGTLAGAGALFRPLGSQPFVQFPYVGGSAGTFGLTAGSGQFGFPGFNATLGPASGGSGNFSGAASFPGLGSPIGSILPGIVLATINLPCTALTGNCRPPGSPNPLNPIVVPVVYTTSPSYLPDEPFLNRTWGQSAFSTFTIGGKLLLFTKPNAPLSVAIVPFYRFYADKAKNTAGFNQLQRGSSPGGNLGDFGVVGIVSGRLSKSANLTANFGYILNSNPKGQFPNGTFAILGRPNEITAGVGFDFPINKYFQPMAEVKSISYVGGKTPNALGNNPVDLLAGFKVYPKRWFGFGAWWRYNANQQSLKHIKLTNANIPITQLSGVVVQGRGLVVVPPTSAPQTTGGVPLGFVPSDDPNGFGFQVFAGHRNARVPDVLPNQPPVVTMTASASTVTLPCPPGQTSAACPAAPPSTVTLTANATDPDGDTLLYTYTTTGGRITGEGANATWDLAGVQPGTYTSTVEVDDGCGCISFSTASVTVAACTGCAPPCPTITVDCPTSAVQPGTAATVTVNLSGGAPGLTPTYNWSVSDGTIASGQGTPSISIDTTGQDGKNITATVEIGGLPPECQRTASCSFSVVKPEVKTCSQVDEYGDIKFNDEKARLDNYAIALNSDPNATGTIIVYAGRTDPAGTAQARGDRAKNYLVTTRGIDAGRITVVDGGCRETLAVDLFNCPAGATPPVASGTVPCEPGPAKARRRARKGRRR